MTWLARPPRRRKNQPLPSAYCASAFPVTARTVAAIGTSSDRKAGAPAARLPYCVAAKLTTRFRELRRTRRGPSRVRRPLAEGAASGLVSQLCESCRVRGDERCYWGLPETACRAV